MMMRLGWGLLRGHDGYDHFFFFCLLFAADLEFLPYG